ncbi:uncharacterized protein TOT_010000690 [Theileria orientalis strain Shintoku]|uniref:Protein kinase domain-containing protein n=1 Tax=Theileria orientalis strain Shintoku TaxID=869250 RepID=J4D5X5_THEOR|nr:uncharacterized protein TOT_010000690 [Theileria orientalis strain Shintoku]BAM39230.1 uncharacterized protein TOT_010000690 [Theileria orientalis strain Shintoku]|eukprot:XP_009689531.1 uncharacterized protein TOT_010000690 [Theileria orientalis strain Shintoku]
MKELPSSCFRSRKGAARKNNKCKIAASEIRECEVEVPLENVPRICSSGTIGNKHTDYEKENSSQHDERESRPARSSQLKPVRSKVDEDKPEEVSCIEERGADVYEKDVRLEVEARKTTTVGGSVSYGDNLGSSVYSAAGKNDNKLEDKLDIYPNVEEVIELYRRDEKPVSYNKLDDIYNIEKVGDFDIYPKSKQYSNLEFTNLSYRAKSDKEVPKIEDVISLYSKGSTVQKKKDSSRSTSSSHKEDQKQGVTVERTSKGTTEALVKEGEAEESPGDNSALRGSKSPSKSPTSSPAKPPAKSPSVKSSPKMRAANKEQDSVSEGVKSQQSSFRTSINEKRARDETKSQTMTSKNAKRKKRGNNWYKNKNKQRQEQEELVGWTKQTSKKMYEHNLMEDSEEGHQSVGTGGSGSRVKGHKYSSFTKSNYDCGGYIQIKYDDELYKYTEAKGVQPEGSFGSTIRHSSMEEGAVGNEEPTITDVFRQNFHLYNDRELINDFNSKYFMENYCLNYNPVTFLTDNQNESDYKGEYGGIDSSNDDNEKYSSAGEHTDNQYSSSSYDNESGAQDSESNERMDSDLSSNNGIDGQYDLNEFREVKSRSGEGQGGREEAHSQGQSQRQSSSKGYVVSNNKVHDLLTRCVAKLGETPEMSSTESLSRVLKIPEMYLETAEQVDVEDLETLRHMEIDLLKSYKKVLTKARVLLDKDKELKRKYSKQISEREKSGRETSKAKRREQNIQTVDLVTYVLSVANMKKRRRKEGSPKKGPESKSAGEEKAQFMRRSGSGSEGESLPSGSQLSSGEGVESLGRRLGSSPTSAVVIGGRNDIRKEGTEGEGTEEAGVERGAHVEEQPREPSGQEDGPGVSGGLSNYQALMKRYECQEARRWLANEYERMERQDFMNFIRDMDETTNTTSSSESSCYSNTLTMSNDHEEDKEDHEPREKEDQYRDVLLGDFKNFYYEERAAENEGADLKQEDLSQMIETMEEQEHTAMETMLDAQHYAVTETVADDAHNDDPARETMVDVQNSTVIGTLEDSQDAVLEPLGDATQGAATETAGYVEENAAAESLEDPNQGVVLESLQDYEQEPIMVPLNDSHHDLVIENMGYVQLGQDEEAAAGSQSDGVAEPTTGARQELQMESLPDSPQEAVCPEQDTVAEATIDPDQAATTETMEYAKEGPVIESFDGPNREAVVEAVQDSQPDVVMVDSQQDVAIVDSQPDSAMVDSQPDGPLIDSQQDVAMVDSQPDSAMVDSQPDGQIMDLQNDGQIMDLQNDRQIMDLQNDGQIMESQPDSAMVDSQSEPVIESIADAQQEAVDSQQEVADQQSPEAQKEERSKREQDETAKSGLYKRRFNKEFRIKKNQKPKSSLSLIKTFNINSKNQVSTPVASSLASSVNASSLLSSSLSVANNGAVGASNLGAVSTSVPITLGASTVNLAGFSIASPKLANFVTTSAGSAIVEKREEEEEDMMNISTPKNKKFTNVNLKCLEMIRSNSDKLVRTINCTFINKRSKNHMPSSLNKDKDNKRNILLNPTNRVNREDEGRVLMERSKRKRSIGDNWVSEMWNDNINVITCKKMKLGHGSFSTVSLAILRIIQPYTPNSESISGGSNSISVTTKSNDNGSSSNISVTGKSSSNNSWGDSRTAAGKAGVSVVAGGSNARIVDVDGSGAGVANTNTGAGNTVANTTIGAITTVFNTGAIATVANTTDTNVNATIGSGNTVDTTTGTNANVNTGAIAKTTTSAGNTEFNGAEDSSNSESDMLSTVTVNRNTETETKEGEKKRLLYECAIKNISDNYGELSRYQYIREKEMMLHYNQHVLKPISYRILYSPNNEKIYQLLLPRAKGDLLTMLNKLIIYRTNLMYNLLYASTSSSKVNGKEVADSTSRIVRSPIYTSARNVMSGIEGINARGVKAAAEGIVSGVGKGSKYVGEGTCVSKRVKAGMDCGNAGTMRGTKGGQEAPAKSGKVGEGSPDKNINLEEFMKRALEGTNRLYGLFEVEIKYLLIQIISGLAFIHMCFQGNILRHTDIKLTNILVFCEEEDRHKPLKWHLNLADFGCSALIKPNQYFNQIQHLYSTLNGLATSSYAYRSSAAKESVYREGLYVERNREESSWEKYMKEWHDQLHHQLLSYNIGTLRYNSPESLLYDQYLNKRLNNNSQLLNILYQDVVSAPVGLDVPAEEASEVSSSSHRAQKEAETRSCTDSSDENVPMKETTLDGIKYIRVDSKSDMWSLGIILSELIKYSIKDNGKVEEELRNNGKLDTFSTYINSLSLNVELSEKTMRNRSKEIRTRLYNRMGNGVFYNRLSSHLNTRKKSKKQFLNNPNYANKDNFGNKEKYAKDKEQVDKENRLLSIYINNVCNNTFEVRRRKMRELYGAEELEGVSDELFDLLVNLLAYEPEQRMHSTEALGHPLFDNSEHVFELVDATNSSFVNKLLSVYTLNTSTKMLGASKGGLGAASRSGSSNATTPSTGSRVEGASGAGATGGVDYDEELYNDGELDSYSWYKGPLYYYFSTYEAAKSAPEPVTSASSATDVFNIYKLEFDILQKRQRELFDDDSFLFKLLDNIKNKYRLNYRQLTSTHTSYLLAREIIKHKKTN